MADGKFYYEQHAMLYAILCYIALILSPVQTRKLSVEFLRQIMCHTHIHKDTVQRYYYSAEKMIFYHCRKSYIKCHAYRLPSEAKRNYTSDRKQQSECPNIIYNCKAALLCDLGC